MRDAWKIRRVKRDADGEIVGALRPRILVAHIARELVKQDPNLWEVMSRNEKSTDDARSTGLEPQWEKYDSLEAAGKAKKV